MAKLVDHSGDHTDQDGSSTIKEDEIAFADLICIPRFLFGLGSQVLVSSSI